MPTWLYGVGMVAIMLIRGPVLSWLFGFVKRAAGSWLHSYSQEQLQRGAGARARTATKPGMSEGTSEPRG